MDELKCQKRRTGKQKDVKLHERGLSLQTCSEWVLLLFLEVLAGVSAPGQVIISPFYQLFGRLVISGGIFHPCRSAVWKEKQKKEKRKEKRGGNIWKGKYLKTKMSWLGKNMWAKVEKIMFFMFQQRLTVWFFPVCSFLPENTSLYVFQTKSATVTLWRSLCLPENVKTQQAPGWRSHPTSPPSPVLHWQHCRVISHIMPHLGMQERSHSYL